LKRDSVCRTLTTTIRYGLLLLFLNPATIVIFLCLRLGLWAVLRTFITDNGSGSKSVIGLEYLTCLVDVLDWGRRTWQNIPAAGGDL
jgi:hypothetical protein